MKKELRDKLSKLEKYDKVYVVYQDHMEFVRSPVSVAMNAEPLFLFAVGKVMVQTKSRLLLWTSGLLDAEEIEVSRGVAGRCMNHFMWIVKEAIVELIVL